jgi:flagellar hook protein FlgE
MGTAIFSGVTGLIAFQRRLDVIASNIANVNTTAYRSSRVLFQDLFSQTLQGPRAPVGNFGGSNPIQVGLGVRIGTIDVNHSQGSLQTTGVSSDLAIQGAGFFVLSNGSSSSYSRDGSFALNANGLLIDPATGLTVQGFTADMNGLIPTDGVAGNLVVPVGGRAIVQATTETTLVGNLDSNAAVGATVTRVIQVFDSLGTPRDVTIRFSKVAPVDDGGTLFSAWQYDIDFIGTDVTNFPAALALPGAARGMVLFDTNGALANVGFDDGAGTFLAALPTTDDNVSVPASLFTGDSIPVTPFEFAIDFNGVTELSAQNDVTMSNQNGFPRGVLESFNIGEGGTINGVFTNGLTVVIGQVAIANFSNISGLERVGNNLFRESPASGTAQIGVAGSGGRGDVTGGVLEGSNVDLGTEFSNMIITQRGFQANARTITTADTLLQEAVNLVR